MDSKSEQAPVLPNMASEAEQKLKPCCACPETKVY